MTTRLHSHSSLPVPVVHAGFSVSQSKSHVLTGVQDAYWSDDEADDAECLLCLEEMDISDLNFKPCICGYQVCRFCWRHIKENLNRRCPACRREYTDDAVQFKPLAKEDHKRLTQQKKQRECERKELDSLGRRQLANVRFVQRNVVYVVGIGPQFAKEELIPTLRSTEYFGQYGKISKILLVKRTPSGDRDPVVCLYITFHRREDAARCIAAVDGTSSPGGGRELMGASYGTTRYCMAFLRGSTCSDHACMNLHEWGDEKDCFTKEDLTTLKHTMKDTECRARSTAAGKKGNDADSLPHGAAWGHKSSTAAVNHVASASIAQRQARRGGATSRQTRNDPAATNNSRLSGTRTHQDLRGGSGSTKTPSQASSSRPSTPTGGAKVSQKAAAPQQPRSPASSIAVESDLGSGSLDASPLSPALQPQSTDSIPVVPPDITPPGLSGPLGLPSLSRPHLDTQNLQATQSSYQMSTAAQALLDDVKARREAPFPSAYRR
ncbi:hypothetical protein PILCRDRAFT_15887 [Piloderma croceum F 1598]|uniref:RING-type domain-containing protein n=1 Tax=Piloderma croceum (strain F 1598) TaxID=765440 RepID=A0A0C3AFW1_PILCF|nr:hypothetical protein PILCRDRAFT_15887 [Piloderma croceum F 1598]